MNNYFINNNNLCKCGYKKLKNKEFCCFICSIGKGHGNKCCGRENNTIIIGSEGSGYNNSCYFINYLIYLYNPNLNPIYKNNNNCELIIYTHFLHQEQKWNNIKKPYILYNNESSKRYWENIITEADNNYINYSKKIIFSTIFEKNINLHIPTGFHDYIKIKNLNLWNNNYTNIKQRKYLFGYCILNTNSKVITNRIKFIDLFTNYTKETYALGEYCNPKSIHAKLEFEYNGDKNHSNFLNKNSDKSTEELIKKYSEFKFILAAENTIEYGYMTEKIINALAAGCIPIYIGSSKYIKKVINSKRIIIANDYENPYECINYILSLTEEDFDNYEKEPIFTNEKESEIFRQLYNRDSPENKKLIDNMKYLLDDILIKNNNKNNNNNKNTELSLNKL